MRWAHEFLEDERCCTPLALLHAACAAARRLRRFQSELCVERDPRLLWPCSDDPADGVVNLRPHRAAEVVKVGVAFPLFCDDFGRPAAEAGLAYASPLKRGIGRWQPTCPTKGASF